MRDMSVPKYKDEGAEAQEGPQVMHLVRVNRIGTQAVGSRASTLNHLTTKKPSKISQDQGNTAKSQ